MAAEVPLQPVHERGWRMGLANMLSKENGAWWRTRFWIVQSVIWLFILNGIVATLLWAAPEQPASPSGNGTGETSVVERLMAEKPNTGLFIFLLMSGIAPVVGAIIIGQDALIAEKQSGTAAWVLSKPVSRTAFVLSKLVGHGLGLLVTAVLLQGLIAYLQVSAAAGRALLPLPFLAALGVVFLNLLFYLTLTLMLGALFDNRGPVIGIPLALLFGYQLFLGVTPWLAEIMPWALVVNAQPDSLPISVALALEQPLPSITPVIGALLWSALFVAVALWRFNREEF